MRHNILFRTVFQPVPALFQKKTMSNIAGLETWTLNPGSKCPPLVEGTLRFYNMRFCPYAQRTLLVLAAKNVPTDIVNVNLKYKPDWLVARNPLGKVPIIEHNGELIFESSVCNEYLDEAFPNTKQILPKNPVQRAKQKMLAELLSKLTTTLHKTIRRAKETEALDNVHGALQNAENLLNDNYYGGSEAGYADYMIWPWFERLAAAELASEGTFKVTATRYPKISAYMERMMERPEVKFCYRNAQSHRAFFQSFLSESGPNYDLDLVGKSNI